MFRLGLTVGLWGLMAAMSRPVGAQPIEMKTQFEGDVASALSANQVAISVDASGLPSKTGAELSAASDEVARTLGLEPVKEERVAFAVKAKGRPPAGETEARAMAQLLGAGRVLLIRAAAAEKEVELSVLGVNARTGVSAQETQTVSRANLPSACRGLVTQVLASIAAPPPPPAPRVLEPAETSPTHSPAPEAVMVPPPPPLAQVPPPSAAPIRPARPPRPERPVARGGAIFGVTVGVQALSMALCYALYAEIENDGRDTEFMDWALGYTLTVPIASAAAGLGMASAKSTLKYNYGSLLLGTYLGSAVAFGLGSAVHYGLGESPSDSPFFWPLTHVILPIVLPAAGAAIFHRLGSRPKPTDKSTVSTARKPNRPVYLPPTLSVSSSSTEGRRLSLSLGSLFF